MTQIILKAAGAAALAVIASLLVVLTFVPMLGGSVDGNGLVMSVACPVVIAFPASAYLLRQKARLADTLQELTIAHDQLAHAHVKLAQAHAHLEERARLDGMTGLLNRSAFFEALLGERENAQAGALLLADADYFKQVNDTYGHQQGDEAIRLIARAIAGSIRESDLVGRIGGEEFAVFLRGANQDDAVHFAERIRKSVESIRFEPAPGMRLPLSVSIGATRMRSDATWAELMREADRHLYEAKHHGRNLVVFEGAVKVAA